MVDLDDLKSHGLNVINQFGVEDDYIAEQGGVRCVLAQPYSVTSYGETWP